MMSNLFRRQITSSNKCELCQLYPKDSLHAIWSCREVKPTWSSFQCFHHTSYPQPLSFSDILSRILQVQEDYREEVFTIAAWLLWNQRNAIHFGRLVHPAAHILSLAGNLLQDFLATQQMDPVLPCFITTQQWHPPELNYHKVNFDAAIFRDSNIAGIWVVVRDWRGEFVGALSSSMPLPHAVANMEALVCRKAVEFSTKIDLQSIVFEGDSAMVITAFNHNSAGLSSYGVVIEDIRSQALVYQSSVFNHISRSCNCVADALAKKAKGSR